jgi:hypothetical protein
VIVALGFVDKEVRERLGGHDRVIAVVDGIVQSTVLFVFPKLVRVLLRVNSIDRVRSGFDCCDLSCPLTWPEDGKTSSATASP